MHGPMYIKKIVHLISITKVTRWCNCRLIKKLKKRHEIWGEKKSSF